MPEGESLAVGALSAESLLGVEAAHGRQRLKDVVNIHAHSRSARVINANQGYARDTGVSASVTRKNSPPARRE